MRKRIKHFNLILVISIILLIIICAPRASKLSLQDLLDFTPESLPLAGLVLIGLYCLKAFVMFIPLTALYIGAGMVFPLGWAIGLTYFSLAVEGTIGFFLGRRLGSERVRALINKSERGKRIMELGAANGILSCFIIRMIPGPPIELTHMFIGTTDIKYPHFIIGTLLGYTPGMIPLVVMGEAAVDPFSKKFLIALALSIVVTVILSGGYLWRKKRARKE